MPKTMTELIADLRSHLDEATARQWTDTELTRWLNEGVRDVARRGEILQTTDDVAATAGVQQYALPTDVLRVYRVEWRPDSGSEYPMEYRDFNSMDSVWWTSQTTSRGIPQVFTMWGYPPNLNMTVFPTPSEDGDFRVFYYGVPAEVTAGTNVPMPEGWTDLAVLYAEYVCLRKDADPRWQEAKALYEERLVEMIDRTIRWTDQSDSIQYRGSVLPGWLVYGDI